MKRILLLLACLSLVVGPVACSSTIRAKATVSRTASFDGGEFNSGFIRFEPDGSGIISTTARDRYNALVAVYGRKFTVPLVHDAGVTPAPDIDGRKVFKITPEALVKFSTMNRWRRTGVKP